MAIYVRKIRKKERKRNEKGTKKERKRNEKGARKENFRFFLIFLKEKKVILAVGN
jgi:hypothetical protein